MLFCLHRLNEEDQYPLRLAFLEVRGVHPSKPQISSTSEASEMRNRGVPRQRAVSSAQADE